MRVAGLSLEDSFLRIAVADRKIGIIKPVRSEDIKLPLSGQERLAAIKEALQNLKDKYKTGKVVLGLDLGNFAHQVIVMPALSEADLRNALFFELEKYLPLPVEEYVFDFLDTGRAEGKKNILVLAVKKEGISEMLNMIRDSGLNLLAVRSSFVEAINEFVASSRVRDAVFIYAGEGAYNIAALKDCKPVFLKTVQKGINAVPDIERYIGAFAGEKYISGHYEQGLAEKLNAKTFPLSLANAIALSSIKRSKIRMNFTPAGLLPKKKDYYTFAIGALSALAVTLFFFSRLYPYYKDSHALNSVDAKIEQLKAKASGLLETRKKLESVYEKRKFLQDFKAGRNADIKALTELSKILPKDAWITSMSIDDKGKVEIEGLAKKAAGVIEPLSKSKFFRKVAFPAQILSQEGMEKFSIKMEIAE